MLLNYHPDLDGPAAHAPHLGHPQHGVERGVRARGASAATGLPGKADALFNLSEEYSRGRKREKGYILHMCISIFVKLEYFHITRATYHKLWEKLAFSNGKYFSGSIYSTSVLQGVRRSIRILTSHFSLVWVDRSGSYTVQPG